MFTDRALKISSHWTRTLWVQIEPGSLVCFSFLACKQESLSRSIEEHFLPWYLRDIGCFQACEGYSVLHKESMRSRRFFSLWFYCRLAGVQRRWTWSIKHSTFSRCAPNKVMCGRADEHMGQRLASSGAMLSDLANSVWAPLYKAQLRQTRRIDYMLLHYSSYK